MAPLVNNTKRNYRCKSSSTDRKKSGRSQRSERKMTGCPDCHHKFAYHLYPAHLLQCEERENRLEMLEEKRDNRGADMKYRRLLKDLRPMNLSATTTYVPFVSSVDGVTEEIRLVAVAQHSKTIRRMVATYAPGTIVTVPCTKWEIRLLGSFSETFDYRACKYDVAKYWDYNDFLFLYGDGDYDTKSIFKIACMAQALEVRLLLEGAVEYLSQNAEGQTLAQALQGFDLLSSHFFNLDVLAKVLPENLLPALLHMTSH